MNVNQQSSSDFIASMHVGSRIFAGICFLLAAAANQQVIMALLQLAISVTILVLLERSVFIILKSVKLMAWIVVPTLLLHAVFTPGELVTSNAAISVSIEGLRSGFWFALHLIVLFFSAVLLSKLLTYREWIHILLHVPVAGRRLLPYALLLESLREGVGSQLQSEASEWRSQGMGIRNFASKMVLILVQGLKQGRSSASRLWHDWDQQVATMQKPELNRKVDVLPTMTAIIAGMLMCYLSLATII